MDIKLRSHDIKHTDRYSHLFGAIAGAVVGGLISNSGGGGDAPQSGFPALPGDVQDFGRDIFGEAQTQFGQGPQQFFPGQTFADLDPLQLQGIQGQLGFAQGGLGQQIGDVQSSFGRALNAGSIFGDPSVQAGLSSIESRGNQNFLENILPGLRRGATRSGQEFGTRGELAAGVAASRTGRDIGDAQASFLANQLTSARSLQGQALGASQQQLGLGLLPGQIQQQLGGVFQGQAGQQIGEDVARFDFGQQAPNAALNQYINQFGNIFGVGGGSAIGSPPPSGSVLGGALGGGLLGNQLSNQFGFGQGFFTPGSFGSPFGGPNQIPGVG